MALHWMLYTLRAQAEVAVPHHSQWPCSDQHPHKATCVTTQADWGCYQHIPHAAVIQLLGSWNWHLLLQHKGSLMHRTAGISHTKSLLFSLFGQSRQVLISWLPTGNKKPLFVLTFLIWLQRGKVHNIIPSVCVWVFLSLHLPYSLSNISTTTQTAAKLTMKNMILEQIKSPNISVSINQLCEHHSCSIAKLNFYVMYFSTDYTQCYFLSWWKIMNLIR